MKTVAIVAPHFPPSNLAGVHRARLLSQHLEEFGWKPLIVTTHWRHYEEALDWGVAALVDPSLEVIHTKALPTKPLRIVGDIGLRAMPWHLRALRRLRREGRLDFLLLTVPSFFSAMLGELLYRETPLPFGIDYIDPWVHVWPAAEVKYSKAWVSMKLGEALEPRAVKNASLLTGVAPGYYEGVLERNPHLRSSAVTAAMPYGFSALDFLAPAVAAHRLTLFDPDDDNFHLVYAGALLPRGVSVLENFLKGLKALRDRGSPLTHRLRVHFIGTGKSVDDPDAHYVLPIARRLGVAEMIRERPHRLPYLEVLAHLKHAGGILILGSTEAHYTPSKVYQAVQSRRPVLALLHHSSTALDVLERSGAGVAMSLSDERLPDPEVVADQLEALEALPYDADAVDWPAFECFSARQSAAAMAAAMDAALEQYAARTRAAASS